MYVVLNYVYLTFLVHFSVKMFFFLYEQDVYFGNLYRCWQFLSNLQKKNPRFFPDKDICKWLLCIYLKAIIFKEEPL